MHWFLLQRATQVGAAGQHMHESFTALFQR